MKNRLVILSLGLIIAGCTSPQSPAPYELKGSKFYGKANVEEENNDISSTEDDEESDFVYQGKVGESNSSRSLDEDAIDFSEEDSAPPRQSYRHGNSTKPAEPEMIKTSKLAPPEHIDAYEDRYDSAQVKVPSFNQQPAKKNTAYRSEFLDLGPVENKASKSIESNLAAPAKQEQSKSYAANITDKLKNITPKEKPNFAEEAEAEEETVHEVAKPKEKPVEKPIKLAAAPQPKNKPASLNQVSPASGNDTEEEKTSFLNIPKKPEPIKIDDRKIEEPKKIEAPKKIEVTSIKEEIQADIRKTDITSIPKMESPAAAASTAGGAKFIRPVEGKIIQEFGAGNDGIKIQASEGTPVKAAAGGEIVYSGNQLQGYGNMLVIRHSNGYLTAYSHLEDLSLKKGAKVSQGDIIGKVGKSGNVSSPQLHFGVRKGRSAVNPRDYL